MSEEKLSGYLSLRVGKHSRARSHTHTLTPPPTHIQRFPRINFSPLRMFQANTGKVQQWRNTRRNYSPSERSARTCPEMPFPLHRGVQGLPISIIATTKLPIKMDPLWLTWEPAGCWEVVSPIYDSVSLTNILHCTGWVIGGLESAFYRPVVITHQQHPDPQK